MSRRAQIGLKIERSRWAAIEPVTGHWVHGFGRFIACNAIRRQPE